MFQRKLKLPFNTNVLLGEDRRRLVTAVTLYILALIAFGIVYFLAHPLLFNATIQPNVDAEKIVLTKINQSDVSQGQAVHLRQTQLLHLEGTAPASTEIALTLCEGVVFRTTSSTDDGTWSLVIPLSLLPRGKFDLFGQFQVDDTLGIPHFLAYFDVRTIDFFPRDWLFYGTSALLLLLSMATLWVRRLRNTPAGNDTQ